MSNKIKVVGYTKSINYGDGIEYRNFSPDLVGNQFTNNGGASLYTLGNFSITTNLDPKINKTYKTNNFSDFLTLTSLNVDNDITSLSTPKNVSLNLDKTNLDNFALFGSLTEFVRVSLENIIINWPASINPNPITQDINGNDVVGYTVEDYQFNPSAETSTFKVNTSFIINKFMINFTKNGNILGTFSETNDLRNMTINYDSYVIYYNNITYPVLEFTAATQTTNDYLYFKVKGNPFSGSSFNQYINYHIRPSDNKVNYFFKSLNQFESFLLNRQVTPMYTATFKFTSKSDLGVILYNEETLTWPVSDGYNIDFDSSSYDDYASKLFNISHNNDLTNSNLMNRFLVSESISDFDTAPVYLDDLHKDTSGQKVNKLLNIYGREFDDLNKYIEGIKFANRVTYNKEENTPDVYLKTLAKVLGWDVISSVFDNNLLSSYITPEKSTFSGQSVGLTPFEADYEMWRRIIVNTPWIWKSKGSRKSVEFLLKFIGAPNGLVQFNEYVYKANAPIDVDIFREVLRLNGLETDLSLYPIDSDGYPRFFRNTDDMYFQNYGLWYRETGGTGSTIDITSGNNPHVGPYDGGSKYFDQLRCLIPNFQPVTLSSETTTTTTQNLYNNYDFGQFDFGVSTATTVDTVSITSLDDIDISDCIVLTTTIEKNPKPISDINECGCDIPNENNLLSICFDKLSIDNPCDTNLESFEELEQANLLRFKYYQYNFDGSLYVDNNNIPILNASFYTTTGCCTTNGGTPWYYVTSNENVAQNNGYICCKPTAIPTDSKCGCFISCSWSAETIPYILLTTGETFILFKKPNGQRSLVTPDGCNCLSQYSSPVPNITDPYTGDVGYGCRLTQLGSTDIALGVNSVIYNHYLSKSLEYLNSNFAACFNNQPQQPIISGCKPVLFPNGCNTYELTFNGGFQPATFTITGCKSFALDCNDNQNTTVTLNNSNPTSIVCSSTEPTVFGNGSWSLIGNCDCEPLLLTGTTFTQPDVGFGGIYYIEEKFCDVNGNFEITFDAGSNPDSTPKRIEVYLNSTLNNGVLTGGVKVADSLFIGPSLGNILTRTDAINDILSQTSSETYNYVRCGGNADSSPSQPCFGSIDCNWEYINNINTNYTNSLISDISDPSNINGVKTINFTKPCESDTIWVVITGIRGNTFQNISWSVQLDKI